MFCTSVQLSDHNRVARAMQPALDNTPESNSRSQSGARAGVVVIVALILASALISGSTKHSLLGAFPGFLHVDKVAHALGFASMGFAFIRSRFARVRPWHVLAFALALGALTELFQRFIPGRTSKVSDVLIDVAGACVGVWFAHRAAWGASPARP
jgi:hypothetical protein